MGLFSFIKDAGAKIFSGDEPHQEPSAANKSISSFIRDHNIDPSGLRFFFNADGTVKVSGSVPSQELREKIVLIVGNIQGIAGVHDEIQVGLPAIGDGPDLTSSGSISVSSEIEPPKGPPEQAVETEPENPGDTAPANQEWSSRTYTVQSGDTLWKIAAEMYGNGAKYQQLFEANQPMLTDADKIYPGQVLRVPAL